MFFLNIRPEVISFFCLSYSFSDKCRDLADDGNKFTSECWNPQYEDGQYFVGKVDFEGY